MTNGSANCNSQRRRCIKASYYREWLICDVIAAAVADQIEF